MTNLLPLNEQKKVWGMFRARFLVALSLVSLALSGFAMLSLLPSYLALEIAAPSAADVTVAHPDAARNDPTAVARAQALVSALRPLITSTTSPSVIIASALDSRPKGAFIEHITYTSGKSGQVTLDGAATREAIRSYREALMKNPYFTAVSVPVGSLVSSDGRFSLSLTGDF